MTEITCDFSKWKERGKSLSKADVAQRWALADWLAEGEKWGGSCYNAAQELFPDYSRKYLQELAYVARAVSFPVRQEELSFTHHQQVAALEPEAQARWLQTAADNGYTVKTLRTLIAGERMTEEPFAIPLPFEVYRKLEDVAKLLKQTKESLVVSAVMSVIESKSGDLAAQHEQECWLRTMNEVRTQLTYGITSEAQREWERKREATLAAYLQENPEPVWTGTGDGTGDAYDAFLKIHADWKAKGIRIRDMNVSAAKEARLRADVAAALAKELAEKAAEIQETAVVIQQTMFPLAEVTPAEAA